MIKSYPKNKPIRKYGKARKKLEHDVFERDGWKCINPECESAKDPSLPHVNRVLTMSHVHPVGRGGSDIMQNCVTECMLCHHLVETHKLSHDFARNYLARIYA
jgi:5-methylcytosine-specific restriction endonuclease McrA